MLLAIALFALASPSHVEMKSLTDEAEEQELRLACARYADHALDALDAVLEAAPRVASAKELTLAEGQKILAGLKSSGDLDRIIAANPRIERHLATAHAIRAVEIGPRRCPPLTAAEIGLYTGP